MFQTSSYDIRISYGATVKCVAKEQGVSSTWWKSQPWHRTGFILRILLLKTLNLPTF